MMQIDGGRQIKSATVTTTQLAANAGITDAQLAAVYLYANGTRALSGNLSVGGNLLNNVGTPLVATDAANKGYVDSAVQGFSGKYSAIASTNTETLTIAAGSVTQITGTTVDGVTLNVNDYVLIMNAPAATGAAGGTTLSTQKANGLYQVSNNTTNLTVARALDMSGTNSPWGAFVFVVGGPTFGGGGFVVTTPSTSAAFTYGTGNIAFTQFSGAGEITVDTTLTKTGNQIVRAAITGDVAIPSNSNTATIQSAAVTLAKMANLAANSVIGNPTGSSATPTAVALASTATVSSVMYRDGNANVVINNIAAGITSTPTAAGTTTLTVGSTQFQQFTGVTTQIMVMPDATTLSVGVRYLVGNRSTGAVTVNANGGSLLGVVAAGTLGIFTLNTNSGATGTWDSALTGTVYSASVVTANGFQGSVATAGTTPAITIQTSLGAGVIKSNGSNAIVLATASSDYMAPASFVTRETPGGTLNGSNTAFTLANTPLSGTEQIYQNGLLLRVGASWDYTISGSSITFNNAPAGTDFLCASYQK